MIQESEVIYIGTIVRLHGNAGELLCRMKNTYWEDADATFIVLNVDNILVPFRVEDWRTQGSSDVVLRLAYMREKGRAERLVGCKAYMLRSDVSEADTQEPDMDMLVGYAVYDSRVGLLGRIDDIDTSTLNTLVRLDSGTLLPLHDDFVERIDAAKQQLYLRLPEGLV